MTRAGRPLNQTDETTASGRLGAAVRAARLAAGLTLEQAAAISGASTSRLSELERGRGDTTISRLRRLAECYNVSLETFFAGE